MNWTASSMAAMFALAALQEPFTNIPRHDVRVGLLTVTESVTRAHPYPEILYVAEGVIEWEPRPAREGTVLLIPAGTPHTLSSRAPEPATLVFYRWAPGGERESLHRPSTMTEPVDWRGIARDDVRMGLQELDPGASYPAHRHPSPEIYVVLSGHARWTVGERSFAPAPGSAVYTPPDTIHRIENTSTTPLRWLYFWWAPGGDVSVLAER